VNDLHGEEGPNRRFERSLHDLIRGIRASKDPTAREAYIRDALADCRLEVRSPDMDTKSMAVIKLAYLEMYGHDMSWASFHVLEVMSSSKFQQKRIGYLAAIQSFREDTDVLMLTTNLLKKDLASSNHLEVSVSLSAAASIVTPSLAQDVSDDIIKMINHSKPYIRKKAVLTMYKVFLQYPEAMMSAFPRLKDKLQDPDPSVVSATVNVICELAKQSPAASKTCLALAPQLYELLTSSRNNWMLIKILKLFSSLTPSEPRLKPKLLPPILQLMQTTNAMSLLYECVNCIVSGGMLDENDEELASLCVSKLRTFLEERDQNLKYMGLLALSKIVNVHPHFVNNVEDIIMECVDDPDLSIRERVLGMISGIVTEENIFFIVNKLLDQLRVGEDVKGTDVSLTLSYRVQVIKKVLELCSKDTYSLLPDFEWYTGVLVELVTLANGADEVAADIGDQLRNVAIRVKSLRDVTAEKAGDLVMNYMLMRRMPSIVPYVVWVVGEYASSLDNPLELLEGVIAGKYGENDDSAPGTTEACIQAAIKLYAWWSGRQDQLWTTEFYLRVHQATDDMIIFLERYATAVNYEVQERAAGFLELLKVAKEALNQQPQDSAEPPLLLTLAIPSLFNGYELNPVAPNSQRKIQVPEDIDLDNEIFPSYELSDVDDEDEEEPEVEAGGIGETVMPEEVTLEEIERRKTRRLERQRDDPFYIPLSSGSQTPRSMTPTPSQGGANVRESQSSSSLRAMAGTKPPRKLKVEILQDEMVEGADTAEIVEKGVKKKSKKPLLKIESKLSSLGIDGNNPDDDEEAALLEVQKLRKELLAQPKEEETVQVTHKKIKKKKNEKGAEGKTKVKKKKKLKAQVDLENPPQESPTDDGREIGTSNVAG
jgi:AP-3 complex subunit delta-1